MFEPADALCQCHRALRYRAGCTSSISSYWHCPLLHVDRLLTCTHTAQWSDASHSCLCAFWESRRQNNTAPSCNMLCVFIGMNGLEPEIAVPTGPFRNVGLSKAAKTHRLRKLRTPSKCRECDSYVYFQGAECEEVGHGCQQTGYILYLCLSLFVRVHLRLCRCMGSITDIAV